MAKANFSSSIGSALEGRSLNPRINNEPIQSVPVTVRPEIKEPEVKNHDIMPNQENVVPDKKAPKIPVVPKKMDPIPVKPVKIAPKAYDSEKSASLVTVGFNIMQEDSGFIRRTSIANRMSKEDLFDTIFREALTYEIDEYDPEYETFSNRFKREVRYTTRIDKELYEQMQEHAAKSYLKISGYINYVIRKYKKLHNT